MDRPLLHVFCVTWNEEKIIQDFIDWYRERVPNCLITFHDNVSDDNTAKIALENKCQVLLFDTHGKMDEQTLINLRNNCWKDSEAHYILVVDADEWVDVNRDMLQRNLDEQDWTVCRCMGYEMFGNEGDTPNDLCWGTYSVGYCKPVLFMKDKVERMNFEAGSHKANPEGDIRLKKNYPNLYHTKHRSWEGMLERCKLLGQRRSDHSIQRGWNFHYILPEDAHKEYRMNGIKNSIRVR